MKTLTALAMILAVAAPAFAADDATTIVNQIDQQWKEAAAKGDAASLAALYTTDAVLMPHGTAEPIIGRANIEKFFTEFLKVKVDNLAIPVTEATMLDQKTLFAAGTWSADVPGEKGAPSIHINGTYMAIDAREGDQWRIRADTWNQMPPPPAQPATAAAGSAPSSGSTAPKN